MVLNVASSIRPRAVRPNEVDGRFGKSSGVHGLLGSLKVICPDDNWTISDSYGVAISFPIIV
jgi:hypothetical protein